MAEGLLAGERVLWSGRPARAGAGLADIGLSLYELAALAVLAVIGTSQWPGLPPLVRVGVIIVAVGAVIQIGVMVSYRLVIQPRVSRGTVYEITDYRVVVTAGLRTRHTWSVYLDQISEPAVRGNRNGRQDLVLRADANSLQSRMLAVLTGDGPFSALGGGLFSPSRASAAAVLRSVADAAQAQQIAAAARRRLRDGLTRPVPTPAGRVTGPLPAGVVLQRGERVLWAGGPVRVPWWFGTYDIYLSVFGLVWLAVMCLMGALAVTGGAGAFLILVVPGAVAGGVYPAAGRLIHRRMRIRRSAYVITSRRLITCWQFGSRSPVIVTAPLRQLLPPAIRWQSVVTDPAAPRERGRAAGWKNLLWPASTTTPPVLIGPADPAALLDLVATAQIALRATPPPAAHPPSPATARPH